MTASYAFRTASGHASTLVQGEFPLTARDFREIAAMLYADAGIHLHESKATLVYSRLAKRLRKLDLVSFREYCALVSAPSGADERRQMLSALTTNVTRFFREPHHFHHLREEVLPPLLHRARRGESIRLWSAACSTGQEPYSIALTILGLEANAGAFDIKILATDIDPHVVVEAERGVYPDSALAETPTYLKTRYFSRVGAPDGVRWTVGEALRGLISFRKLNLNAEWPLRRVFQVIFCRNVVIYFDERTQQMVWSKFATKLQPGGWLYIGHSERVSGPAGAFFSSAGVTTYQMIQGAKA